MKYTEGPTRTKPSKWNTQKDQQGQGQVSEIHRRTNKGKAKSVKYTEGPRAKPSQWNTQKDQQGQSQVSEIHRRTNKGKAKSVKYREGPTRAKPSQWNTEKDQQGQSQLVKYTEGPTRTKPSWWNTQKDQQGQSQVSEIHRRTKDLGQLSEMRSWTGQQRLSQVWKLQSEDLTRGLFRPVDWMYYHKVHVLSILWCINTEVTPFPLARPNSYKKTHFWYQRTVIHTKCLYTWNQQNYTMKKKEEEQNQTDHKPS